MSPKENNKDHNTLLRSRYSWTTISVLSASKHDNNFLIVMAGHDFNDDFRDLCTMLKKSSEKHQCKFCRHIVLFTKRTF